MSRKCGGLSEERPMNKEVESSIRHLFILSTELFSFKTQVVAGINYFVKARLGDNVFHARIYQDLNNGMCIHSIQKNKKLEDPIEYF